MVKRLAILISFLALSCGPTTVAVPKAPPPPEMRVWTTPSLVFAGNAAWVRCFVPRHTDNRYVAYGVPGVRMSGNSMEGADAVAYYEVLVEHIPCGNWEAVCNVADNFGDVTSRKQTLIAKGECNAGDDK